MAQQIIGNSRQAQRIAAPIINDNFTELYAAVNNNVAGYSTITANYTLTAADSANLLLVNSGSAVTITLPNNLPVGFATSVVQMGAGQVTFTAASGAILTSRQTFTKTAGQYADMGLLIVANAGGASARYLLTGDGAA